MGGGSSVGSADASSGNIGDGERGNAVVDLASIARWSSEGVEGRGSKGAGEADGGTEFASRGLGEVD